MISGPWKCFHCGATFTAEMDARQHFGPDEMRVAACVIKAAEGGLLRALRDAEDEAERAWNAVHAESVDGLRAYRSYRGRQEMAIQAAEQLGYERGLADHAATIERLRRILHRYGDRVPLAMCHRPDWQQEIDEAMGWVADNPEAPSS